VTTAVVFGPALYLPTYANQCFDYCSVKGYEIAGIVQGDWQAVVAMLTAGAAGVAVAARPEHLDPDREPRVEIAAPPRPTNDGPTSQYRSARDRRPRRI
jgi:hypothetical protein